MRIGPRLRVTSAPRGQPRRGWMKLVRSESDDHSHRRDFRASVVACRCAGLFDRMRSWLRRNDSKGQLAAGAAMGVRGPPLCDGRGVQRNSRSVRRCATSGAPLPLGSPDVNSRVVALLGSLFRVHLSNAGRLAVIGAIGCACAC